MNQVSESALRRATAESMRRSAWQYLSQADNPNLSHAVTTHALLCAATLFEQASREEQVATRLEFEFASEV